MHQPSEPKSLSDWEEVGNPLILHNTPTHVQPEQGANVEIEKGAEDLKDASTRTRTRDLWLWYHVRFQSEPRSLSDWEEVGNPLILHNKDDIYLYHSDQKQPHYFKAQQIQYMEENVNMFLTYISQQYHPILYAHCYIMC
jgi:hypothetical protein